MERALPRVGVFLVERRLRWVDWALAALLTVLAYGTLRALYRDLPLSPAGPDMTLWFWAAWGFESGRPEEFHAVGRPPLLPFLVSLLSPGVEGLGVAAVRATLGSGALLVGGMYLAGARLLGRAAGLVPILWLLGLYDIWQLALWFNGQILLNALLPLELALGYWALRRAGAWPHVLWGILLALMALSREQGWAFVPIALGVTLLPGMGPEGLTRRDALTRAGALLLGLGLVMIPLHLAVPPPPSAGVKSALPLQDLLRFLQGEIPPVAREQTWAEGYDLDWVRGGGIGGLTGWRLRALIAMGMRAWEMIFPYHSLVTFGAAGLVVLILPKAAALRRPALFILAHLAPFLLGCLTFGYPYHLSFVVPPLLLLTAVGPAGLLRAGVYRVQTWPWLARAGLSLCLTALIGAGLYRLTPRVWSQGLSEHALRTRVRRDMRPFYAEAGLWLRERSDPGAVVASGQQIVHIFAERGLLVHDSIPLPARSCPPPRSEIPSYYVVLDDVEAVTFWRRMGTPGAGPPSHFKHAARFEREGIPRGLTLYEVRIDGWSARLSQAEALGEAPGFARYCAQMSRP